MADLNGHLPLLAVGSSDYWRRQDLMAPEAMKRVENNILQNAKQIDCLTNNDEVPKKKGFQ